MYPVLFRIGHFILPSYGVSAALGVLLALGFAQWTAQRSGLPPSSAGRHAWNMLLLAVFASLAVSRLVLIAINFGDLSRHPAWLLALAMVHHPLLTALSAAGGATAVFAYSRWNKLPLRAVADFLAAPASIAMAAEQTGALLAGSDYGRESAHTSIFLAITYSNELAARWSGTPLGIPLYPVQAYAAAGFVLLTALALGWLSLPHRSGDAAGVALLGAGVLLFFTEGFRDWEGRGALFYNALDIPQLVGLGMVLGGGLLFIDWPTRRANPQKERNG